MEYENKHGLKRTIRGAVSVAMEIAGGAFGEKYKQPILCTGSLPKW